MTGTPVIRDSAGNDVTQQFVVRTESGTMTIKKRLLILTSESAEKVYDGTALTKDQVTVSGDGFADGEGAVFNVTGSQLLTGSSENAFTCTFKENTKRDNYEVRTVNGLLTVTGRSQDARFEITLEAASGEAMYDGAVHTVSGIDTLSFEIGGVRYTVEGAAASGSGVDAGTYEIPVTGDLRVLDSDGHDVTDQFRIVTKSGTLTIAKRNVTLTSPTAEQIYNGLTLTAPQIEISGDGFAEGEGVSFTVTGSRLLTGTSENTFTYRIIHVVLDQCYHAVFGNSGLHDGKGCGKVSDYALRIDDIHLVALLFRDDHHTAGHVADRGLHTVSGAPLHLVRSIHAEDAVVTVFDDLPGKHHILRAFHILQLRGGQEGIVVKHMCSVIDPVGSRGNQKRGDQRQDQVPGDGILPLIQVRKKEPFYRASGSGRFLLQPSSIHTQPLIRPPCRTAGALSPPACAL